MSVVINESIQKARSLRLELGIGENDTVNIMDILKYKENITILKLKLSDSLSGMILTKGNAKAIVINSNMTLGRQNFTAAHEYYHLKYDNINQNDKEAENKADQFASHFLVSESALENILFNRGLGVQRKKITVADLVFLENYFKISHSALLKRLREKYINSKEYEEFKNIRIVDMAIKLGYNRELYTKTGEDKFIFSNYAELAEVAFEKEKISRGKYEEYMISGGYEDIVFGFVKSEDGEDVDDEIKDCF